MSNLDRKTNPASSDITQLANTIVERLDRPLALVGLMGSGKSTVGRRTAKKLGLSFTDSDQKIVSNAGISISEIFELAGEAKFREMEFQAITQLVLSKPQIIATGGGAFCFPQTARLLSTKTLVVWLKAPPETLLARIGSAKSRPLLNNDNPFATLAKLNKDRAKHYEKAQIEIDTDGLSTRRAMMALLHALDTYLARH
ncbi:shikimate kinase [Candidatus Puniceispirillum sp.]|nr:shikimate kinase [Candidatus Puniceispirillum sp.]